MNEQFSSAYQGAANASLSGAQPNENLAKVIKTPAFAHLQKDLATAQERLYDLRDKLASLRGRTFGEQPPQPPATTARPQRFSGGLGELEQRINIQHNILDDLMEIVGELESLA
jgi:uncharacterized coiled-coil protein SlyX